MQQVSRSRSCSELKMMTVLQAVTHSIEIQVRLMFQKSCALWAETKAQSLIWEWATSVVQILDLELEAQRILRLTISEDSRGTKQSKGVHPYRQKLTFCTPIFCYADQKSLCARSNKTLNKKRFHLKGFWGFGVLGFWGLGLRVWGLGFFGFGD